MVGEHAIACVWQSQETCEGWLYLSTIWVLGIELWSSGLVASLYSLRNLTEPSSFLNYILTCEFNLLYVWYKAIFLSLYFWAWPCLCTSISQNRVIFSLLYFSFHFPVRLQVGILWISFYNVPWFSQGYFLKKYPIILIHLNQLIFTILFLGCILYSKDILPLILADYFELYNVYDLKFTFFVLRNDMHSLIQNYFL